VGVVTNQQHVSVIPNHNIAAGQISADSRWWARADETSWRQWWAPTGFETVQGVPASESRGEAEAAAVR
jgi:hypothetical protein